MLAGAALRMPAGGSWESDSCLPFVSLRPSGAGLFSPSGVSGEDPGTCPGLAPEGDGEGLLPCPGVFLSTFPPPCVGERERKELNPQPTWLLYLPGGGGRPLSELGVIRGHPMVSLVKIL